MVADITVTLEGDPGEIGAAPLHAALGHTLHLLREAGVAVGATAGRWNIRDLRLGSVIFAVDNPAASGVVSLVKDGLNALSRQPAIPTRWTQAMVRHARDLGRLEGDGGVHHVSVVTADGPPLRLTSVFTANAERAVQARDISQGSVQGVVDKWDERRGHQIGLTLVDGQTLTASYPAALAERILRDALGHQIEARGELRRNAAGQRVHFVMHDFSVVVDDPPVSVEALAGLYRELGDAGLTAMEVLAHRE